MSPIIDLQRRMVEAGRIRAGEKGDKGEPKKLDKWRLTSKDRVRLQAAANLWGGEVREWAERKGEFELYTDTDTLPIMLLPGQLPTTWYELWSKGGCQRRCDGQHEVISDSSCLCGEERECKPTTRLSVLLPDLVGVGSWLVSSTGWNAAAELAGAADLLQRASAQGVLIPARLRLEQRVDVKAGQTRRYAVPVIDVDVSFRELLGGQIAQPLGYTPIKELGIGNGVSLEDGLKAAETQVATRSARSAAPIPALDDDVPFGEVPVPVDEPGPEAPSPAQVLSRDEKPLTKAQASKLGVLVGWLRDELQTISTEQLYAWVAKHRNIDASIMTYLVTDAYTPDGILHWGPLQKTLVRTEASALIDALVARYGEKPE